MILAALRKGTIDQFQIRLSLPGGLGQPGEPAGGELQRLSFLTADHATGHEISPGWVNLKDP
jgi:hypothetical protein